MIRIGNGPNLEVFEISGQQSAEAGLTDLGLNYMCFYCDDIDSAPARLVAAGGQALSEVHENSRYADSEGEGSVHVKAPWGMLVELQSIPAGHHYLEGCTTRVSMPDPRPQSSGLITNLAPVGRYDEARTIP